MNIKDDIWYMQEALREAQIAYDQDEVPIGAVVVNIDGDIIGRAYNQVQKANCQTAHAEMLAIAQAGSACKDWRLTNCTMFVTLEPCRMCMELIHMSRMTRVVFGATSPLFGYRLDNEGQHQLYKKDIVMTQAGVMAEQAGTLLKRFFTQKRKERT